MTDPMRRATSSITGVAIASLAALALLVGVASPSVAYVRPGVTQRVDVSSAGAQAEVLPTDQLTIGAADYPAISANGRYVAFVSHAFNLTPGDVSGVDNVYLRDTWSGTTTLVSVGLGGAPSIGACRSGASTIPTGSNEPAISADGRYISFSSCATNLVSGDTNTTQDVFVRDMKKKITSRVDVSSKGAQANGQSYESSIDASGRSVAFVTSATNLFPHDTNGTTDILVRDDVTKKTVLASADPKGQEGNGSSDGDSISATGRYVAFESVATNLVENDTSSFADMFVRDMKTGRVDVIHRASRKDVGTICMCSAISADGRYVAYASNTTNNVPNQTNRDSLGLPAYNVFVYDRVTRRTQRVSVSSSGEQDEGDSGSTSPRSVSISADGRYVAFFSEAFSGNQVFPPLGSRRTLNVFVYDRTLGALHMLSVSSRGELGNDSSQYPAVSADGRHVAFWSHASNLVAHDTNGIVDTFVRDWGPSVGVGGLGGSPSGAGGVCVGPECLPQQGALSSSDPTDDVGSALSSQGANLVGASLVCRPRSRDLFVREELASMSSVSGTPLVGNPGILYGFDLTAGGRRYEVRVQRVPGPDFDQAGGASFGLFRFDNGLWTHIATLRGGYGTTGEEIVFALPLKDIGAQSGGRLAHLNAFTALGTFDTGAVTVLDRVPLGKDGG